MQQGGSRYLFCMTSEWAYGPNDVWCSRTMNHGMTIVAQVAQAVITRANPMLIDGPDNALQDDHYDIGDVSCDGYSISYDHEPYE